MVSLTFHIAAELRDKNIKPKLNHLGNNQPINPGICTLIIRLQKPHFYNKRRLLVFVCVPIVSKF